MAQTAKRGTEALRETRLADMATLAAPKRKRVQAKPKAGAAALAALPKELSADYVAGLAAIGALAAGRTGTRSRSRTGTRSRSGARSPVVLSPKRAEAGARLHGMLKRMLVARNVQAQAEDMRLVRENMRSQLVVGGARKGRGQRKAPRLQDELLRAHAAGLALDELENVVRSAEQFVSSRESASGLSADEAQAVRQDVAMASLMFQGRADRSMNTRERKQLDALALRLAPVGMRSGEEGLERAAARIRGLFAGRLPQSELRRRLKSFLGGSAQLKRLQSVLSSPASVEGAAAGEAALSASRSSEVGRRAKAAVLRRATAAGSRSGDEAAAGTDTRSFVASRSGSLRSARASTRTSSRSAKTVTRTSQRSRVATPVAPIAKRLPARAARGKAQQRYGVAEGALLGMKEVAKKFLKAKGHPDAARKQHDLRVEFFIAMMQTLPGHLDEEQRRELNKLVQTVFAGRERAAREAAVQIFGHKSAASMLRSPDKRRLKAIMARILTASELESVQNEFDWISSVSRGSHAPSPSRGPRRILSEPAVVRSRLGSFSIDQSAVSSAAKPRYSTIQALERLRSLVRGARANKRRIAAARRARSAPATRSGSRSPASSSSASTWLKQARARRAARK